MWYALFGISKLFEYSRKSPFTNFGPVYFFLSFFLLNQQQLTAELQIATNKVKHWSKMS